MPVDYKLEGPVATISWDDGKVNALSLEVIGAINDALDRALDDDAVVVLRGRDGILSAGFDLRVLRAGGFGAATMVRAGFELGERLLSFPAPVLIVCDGHAVAMGSFLLLCGDYRLGVDGPFRIQANEVAIGLPLPPPALEILRQRLTPAGFNRATVLAEAFSPADAVSVGFLDRVVPAADLDAVAADLATNFAALDRGAHRNTKRRIRAESLAALRAALAAQYDRDEEQ